MVAGGLPTVQVLLDNGAAAFPYDVTTYARMVDDLGRTLGRQDELSQVTPGQLNLVLDNTDGRFTLGSTTIASPSPIVVDQKIRVKVTANATTVNWFTGYVQQWPVGWPSGDDTFATVAVLATDAQARAERAMTLPSAFQEYLADAPVAALYPLNGPAGVDLGSGAPPAFVASGSGAAPVWGQKMANGLPAVQFVNGGQWLTSTYSLSGMVWVVFQIAAPPASNCVFLGVAGTSNAVYMDTTGKIGNASGTWSASTYADGLPHLLGYDPAGGKISIDNVGNVATTPSTAATGPIIIGSGGAAGWTGLLSMLYDHPFASMAADYTAFTGFAGDLTSARVTRVAGLANIPTGTIDTGLTTMTALDVTTTAADALRQASDAELGTVFIDGSGNLTFHNRNRPAAKTTPDLTIDANQLAEDTAVIVDTFGLLNYYEVTAAGTGAAQLVRNTVSELGDGTATHPGHGRFSGSASYAVQTDVEAVDRGNWTVTNHAEALPRLGSLPVTVLDMTAAQQATVLSLTLNAWIRVTGLPSQTPGGTTLDLAVVGFSESISATEWKVVYNVVPRSFFTAWILDNTTYSVLGTTTKLYV